MRELKQLRLLIATGISKNSSRNPFNSEFETRNIKKAEAYTTSAFLVPIDRIEVITEVECQIKVLKKSLQR